MERFETKYELPEDQRKLAEAKMDQAKERAVLWLLGQGGKDSLIEVEKSFNGAALVKLQENSREKLEEYGRKSCSYVRSWMRSCPASAVMWRSKGSPP